MLERLKNAVRSMFSDRRDAWSGQKSRGGPLVRVAQPQHPVQVLPPPQTSTEMGIGEMREQLIAGEAMEETQSVTRRRIHIVRASRSVVSSRERRSFTEEGLVTHTDEFFLHTAEGRLITGPELHGGGQCFVCRQFTDKIEFCAVCRRPLCFACAHPWESIKVCPEHQRLLAFHRDTWAEGR